MITGFTCSCWDLLHAGHILFLNEAKEYCDYLIVGVQSDPTIDRPSKNKPIESLEERLIKINALKQPDKIFKYNTEKDLYEYLMHNEKLIDIRFLGSDYKNKHFTGDDLDIKIHYHERNHNFSSSNIRERILSNNITLQHNVIKNINFNKRNDLLRIRGFL